jgi:hypothetical protein
MLAPSKTNPRKTVGREDSSRRLSRRSVEVSGQNNNHELAIGQTSALPRHRPGCFSN